MKRIVLLVMLLCAAMAYAVASKHTAVRPAGSNEVNTGYWMAVDSTDTVPVDTFFSDTVTLNQTTEAIMLATRLHGFTVCDSCNDSIMLIVSAFTDFDGKAPRNIWTDTFGTDGTLDSTETLTKSFYADTLLYTQLYFRTILYDSVIIGNDTPDSLRVDLDYHVMERYRDE